MTQPIYCWTLAALLILSALCHIAAPGLRERWMTRVPVVCTVGILLLLMAIPCAIWQGWYFWMVFIALTASGLWRAVFPRSSIRAQKGTYPRWVHGCLLHAGALLVLALKP